MGCRWYLAAVVISQIFGPTNVSVPVIGQGTWRMELADRRSAIAALRAGLDLGMTHIDTSELLGSGTVEEIVGEAISGRRHEVYLVSKVRPASRAEILEACEQSLSRLRTDWLDCYLLNWWGDVPFEVTAQAFEELRDKGKIRAWGVSNFDERQLRMALDVVGPGKIACNQVLYHLLERSIEHRILPFCEMQGIAVVGYTPFGPGTFPPRGAIGKTLNAIATRHDATPRQVALAFLTRRRGLFAIPKAANPAHKRENAEAARLRLDAQDLAAIETAFPIGPPREGAPRL